MVTERHGIHNTNDLSLINKWIFDRSAWQWIFKAIFQPFSTPALLFIYSQPSVSTGFTMNYC